MDKTAYDVAMHIAKQTSLLKSLYEDKTVEGIARYENMEELLNGIKEFSIDQLVDDDGVVKARTLPGYMEDIALLTDADKDNGEDNDKVSMMTIHASKGLEFRFVYIVGLEENLFPSQMALNSRSELEEERRLFYVALTRAMKKLTLSFSTSRFKFGTMISCEPSRFLQELDAKHLNIEGMTGAGNNESRNTGYRQESKPAYGAYGRSSSASKQTTKPSTPPLSVTLPKNFKPINKAVAAPQNIDPNFVGDDTSKLAVGQQVEHQRFGMGTVLIIEGAGDGRKANIDFAGNGKKMIVLKFAKLKLI
jgi:DNA helicase-2/ATP-dependent DNA helicase PcrA